MPDRSTYVAAAPWAVLVVLYLLLPMRIGNYHLYLFQRVLILAILALGLNLFMGYCGQVNFGLSGFYAAGAYACGILEVKAGLHPFLTLVPAVVGGTVLAYLLSKVFLRLRHLSLALGTIAFGLTVFVLLRSAVPRDWGGGDSGFGLPAIVIGEHRLGFQFHYYYLGAWLAVVFIACVLLVRSRIGRAWQAIREDETAAATSGVDVRRYMTIAFVINGTIGTLAGVLLAQQSRYLVPDSFDLFSNLLPLLVLVIGGMASNVGMLLGATILIFLDEAIDDYFQGFPTLAYGLVLFVIMRFLPRGMWFYLRDGAVWVWQRRERGGLGRASQPSEPRAPREKASVEG